jgi:hypothetical protein
MRCSVDDAVRAGALSLAVGSAMRAAMLGMDVECVEVVPRHGRKGRVDLMLTMWTERGDGGWERLTLGPDGELVPVQAPNEGPAAEVVNLFPKGVK